MSGGFVIAGLQQQSDNPMTVGRRPCYLKPHKTIPEHLSRQIPRKSALVFGERSSLMNLDHIFVVQDFRPMDLLPRRKSTIAPHASEGHLLRQFLVNFSGQIFDG